MRGTWRLRAAEMAWETDTGVKTVATVRCSASADVSTRAHLNSNWVSSGAQQTSCTNSQASSCDMSRSARNWERQCKLCSTICMRKPNEQRSPMCCSICTDSMRGECHARWQAMLLRPRYTCALGQGCPQVPNRPLSPTPKPPHAICQRVHEIGKDNANRAPQAVCANPVTTHTNVLQYSHKLHAR